MHFSAFFRAYGELDRAHGAFKDKAFEAKVTASDLRYLSFLHLCANLHLWLSGQAAARFNARHDEGNFFTACVLQDDLRVRLLGRVLRLADPHVTPPPEAVSAIFGYGRDEEAMAYFGFCATVMAELCARVRPPDDPDLKAAIAWLADGYRAQAAFAFAAVREAVAAGKASEDDIREVASAMTFPGEQLLEGFAREARAALGGRLSKADLVEAARGLRGAPGIGDGLGKVIESHMKRFDVPWAARKIARAAVRALVRH